MRLLKYTYGIVFFLFSLLVGCDDMRDVSLSTGNIVMPDGESAEVYVLSEGLFNFNNSSLARYSYRDGSLSNDYFNSINKRGLGDTANDMLLYGDKLYIVVNVSSEVEVVDFLTGKSLKQIPLLTEKGVARQPRYIASAKGNVYVCSFDGTVERIDTTSLNVTGIVKVGRNPDGICVANGKLYISNSGGLDKNTIGVDNTVSVIEVDTFSETKKIEVGPNPGKIIASEDGMVYVVTRGKDIDKGDYHLVTIDSRTDQVTKVLYEKVLNLAIQGDIAYMYQYNYSTKQSSIKVYNLSKGIVVRENFITDGTTIQTPYAIAVNPSSGNVYIVDAYDYRMKSDLLCFSPQGVLQFRLKDIGMNSNTILFTDRITAAPDETETKFDYAYADTVFEYMPAPSQYMNTLVTAYADGYTHADVLHKANDCLKQKSLLTLGAFGGYIVLGFNHTVKNVTGEYDFKIYGNASLSIQTTKTGKDGGASEPAIVWVSQDANGNGKPDDEWYELAGSEYGKATETRNYSITYYRPLPANSDVKWMDNQGNSGFVYRNQYHTQSSYYPLWMPEQITFTGTRLKDNAVNEGTTDSQYWVGYCYDWGYADNYPNSSEKSRFKIDWAVDAQGNKVNLPGIDFIRITTAVNQSLGWMGESSAEIQTVQDLHY